MNQANVLSFRFIITFLFLFPILGLVGSLRAYDNPVFYRSSLFQGMPKSKTSDWTTGLSARYVQGRTSSSHDARENKKSLLAFHGPIDLVALGIGIENPEANTRVLWGKDKDLFNLANNVNRSGDDGKITFNGRLKVQEVSLELEQSLFSGFFVKVYVPIRHVRMDQIEPKNLGKKRVVNSAGKVIIKDIDSFIENDLIKVLSENGFKMHKESYNFALTSKNYPAAIPTYLEKTEIPEAVFSVGWQATNDNVFNYIKEVRGTIQAGVIVPLGAEKDENKLFDFPLGYNNQMGFNARLNAEIVAGKVFVVGGSAGVSVFLKADRLVRMKTDKKQSGLFVLGKGMASVDQGSIWDLGGYVKAERVIKGLSFLIGYSFTKQEPTSLIVKDDVFLKTVVENAKDPILGPKARFISKDAIVNSDERLRGWEHQILHLLAQYDGKVHTNSSFVPTMTLEYDYPIAGRMSLPTDMFGGSLEFSANWLF